jgi:hypothetical protein
MFIATVEEATPRPSCASHPTRGPQAFQSPGARGFQFSSSSCADGPSARTCVTHSVLSASFDEAASAASAMNVTSVELAELGDLENQLTTSALGSLGCSSPASSGGRSERGSACRIFQAAFGADFRV